MTVESAVVSDAGQRDVESVVIGGAVMRIGAALRRARTASIVNGRDANPIATPRLATALIVG